MRASPLTFEDIDHTAFPLFGLGTEAGRRGGAAPAAFNASNEVAVRAFLDGHIRMPEIAEVVFEALEKVGSYGVGGLDDVLSSDADARAVAGEASRRMSQARIGVTS